MLYYWQSRYNLTIMSRNNRQEPFLYKSQANKNINSQVNSKLYTSNAYQNSWLNSYTKPTHSIIPSKPNSKAQRAIDALSNNSHIKSFASRELIRNKSAEQYRFQSPSRCYDNLGGFKSIIEQINQNNDKTLDQLDSDLRRIKYNIAQVQTEITHQKNTSEIEALYQEIQLLQEENERLRTKNLELVDEKKKISHSLEQCEALIQKETIKRQATVSSNRTNDQMIQDIKEKTEFEQKFKQLTKECERLHVQNETFSRDKSALQKRESVHVDEKKRLAAQMTQLQRELNLVKLEFEDKLSQQLLKKDGYYFNLLSNKEKQYEQNLKSMRSQSLEHQRHQLDELIKQKDENLARLQSQAYALKNTEIQHQKLIDNLSNQLRQTKTKVNQLTNEMEFLTFSHKQSTQNLQSKEQQMQSLRAKIAKLQGDCSYLQSQVKSAQLQYEQQKNRCTLLQQLYDRLQRDSNDLEQMNQELLSNYNQEIYKSQQQINRLHCQIQALKQDKNEMQLQLHEAHQHHEAILIQNNKKSQEILQLKHQHLVLINQQRCMRIQPSYHNPIISPQKYDRRQRFNSGQHKPYQLREKDKEQFNKIRAIEKQFDTLMREYKAQYQKQTSQFKIKEKKLRQNVQAHRKKIEDLTHRIEAQKRQSQSAALERSKKEEDLLKTIQRKEQQIHHLQTKYNHLLLTSNRLQRENESLKSEVKESKKIILTIQTTKEKQRLKFVKIKQDVQIFLANILRQMKSLQSLIMQDNLMRKIDLYTDLKQISFTSDIRLISDLNFTLNSLKQSLNSFIKSFRQLQKQKQHLQHYKSNSHNVNTHDSSQQQNLKIQLNEKYSQTIRQKELQVIEKERWIKELIEKFHELQIKLENKNSAYNKVYLELQNHREVVASQEKQVFTLKTQIQSLQAQNEKKDIRVKQMQIQIAANLGVQNRYKQQFKLSLVTPTKNYDQFLVSDYDLQSARQITMRERIRSARHQSPSLKRQSNIESQLNSAFELELTISALKRNLEEANEQITSLKDQKHQLQLRLNHSRAKVQEKQALFSQKQQENEKFAKKTQNMQMKITHLQKDISTLTQELESLAQKCNESWSELVSERQEHHSAVKRSQYQRDMLERQHKNQLLEKDSKMIKATQLHELKVVELNGQINRLKDKLHQQQNKNQQLRTKFDKMNLQNRNNVQRNTANETTIRKLQERIQAQEAQRERIFETFKANTAQLTKILQQRQIQIEELKFIQESTIINLQSAKAQIAAKQKNNQSIYSFQHDD